MFPGILENDCKYDMIQYSYFLSSLNRVESPCIGGFMANSIKKVCFKSDFGT
jgi:hypothetical protein